MVGKQASNNFTEILLPLVGHGFGVCVMGVTGLCTRVLCVIVMGVIVMGVMCYCNGCYVLL